MRRRITQQRKVRGLTYERFTIEFYSLDMLEVYDVGYRLKVILDLIETDDGELFRCYNKNIANSITENHFSLMFNIKTEPYVEGEPLIKMTSLDLDQKLDK